MAKEKTVFVDYRNFEPADLRRFQDVDPTPEDKILYVEDWRRIPAIHYQELYEIIGGYQVITRLGRFDHPSLLLVPDGRTFLIAGQRILTREGETVSDQSPLRDPYGKSGIFLRGDFPLAQTMPYAFPPEGAFHFSYTYFMEGASAFAGRVIPNAFGKEPADFEPEPDSGFCFSVKEKGNKKTLTLFRCTFSTSIAASFSEVFLRHGNTTVELRQRDLENYDSQSVVDVVDLPSDTNRFDIILADHAGNQSSQRYRIIPTRKGPFFMQEANQQTLREMEGFQIAVASLNERGYQIIEAHLNSHENKNPYSVLQSSGGSKIYSAPAIGENNRIEIHPFKLDFSRLSRRHEKEKCTEDMSYVSVRNWLSGDIVFETVVAGFPSRDCDNPLKIGVADFPSSDKTSYRDDLLALIQEAVERHRDKHGMQAGGPIPKEMLSHAKSRDYPLLIQAAEGQPPVQSFPEALKQAVLGFHIVDIRRDRSLPVEWGTFNNPVVYSVTTSDLKKRPIIIRGEVFSLEIKIPRRLEGTQLTPKIREARKELRDKYGNYIMVEEDGKEIGTKIFVLLKPERSREPKEDTTKYQPIHIDFSKWVPALGDLRDIAMVEVQRPKTFVGPDNVYAVYSHFSEKKWRQARHTLPKIEAELVEIEKSFGLKPGTVVDSVLFQDSREVNASVLCSDPKTVRIHAEMLESFGNWEHTAWHEAAHALDHYFQISNEADWKKLYEEIKNNFSQSNFFLFIAETNFLPDVGGHPWDNPAELFATVMVSLTHPDLLKGLEPRCNLHPDKSYVEKYAEVLHVLLNVLGKKLPPNAPILQTVSAALKAVEQALGRN